jgi:hypothetical protein
MESVEIKKINYGIACRVGNKIYMNNRLTEYPKLFNAILNHEKSHTSGFIWNDIILDIGDKNLERVKKDYYIFILKNPSSWIEFLPFWIYDKKIVFNPLIMAIYFISALITKFIIIRI